MSVNEFKPANSDTFVGLSTDTKPTGASTGDNFFETDTAKQFIWNGAWTLALQQSTSTVAATAGTADAVASTTVQEIANSLFNGTTWDRQRGNFDTAAVVTLAAASAGGNSTDQINFNGRGLQLGINITALTGTSPTLTVTVQGKDAASGAYYPILVSAVLAAVAFTQITVYPGALTSANVSTPQPLPRIWRILYAIGGTTPAVTATIGASVIV